jgi:hypothetical protein
MANIASVFQHRYQALQQVRVESFFHCDPPAVSQLHPKMATSSRQRTHQLYRQKLSPLPLFLSLLFVAVVVQRMQRYSLHPAKHFPCHPALRELPQQTLCVKSLSTSSQYN